MKVVFDTNIYISGFLFKGGCPSLLIDLAETKKFALYYSPEILEELKNTLMKGKFAQLGLHEKDKYIRIVESMGEIVYPTTKIDIVKADDNDNQILECALSCEADYLITGDKKHLLSLKHPFRFKIVSPAEFYKIIFSM